MILLGMTKMITTQEYASTAINCYSSARMMQVFGSISSFKLFVFQFFMTCLDDICFRTNRKRFLVCVLFGRWPNREGEREVRCGFGASHRAHGFFILSSSVSAVRPRTIARPCCRYEFPANSENHDERRRQKKPERVNSLHAIRKIKTFGLWRVC